MRESKLEDTSHIYIKGKRVMNDIVCTITPSVSKYGYKMYKIEIPGEEKPLEVGHESAVRHIEEIMRFWSERGCDIKLDEHPWSNKIVIRIVWPSAA